MANLNPRHLCVCVCLSLSTVFPLLPAVLELILSLYFLCTPLKALPFTPIFRLLQQKTTSSCIQNEQSTPMTKLNVQANGTRPAKHVAVLAFPFGTHAGPLLSLIRRLSEAAPEVTFSFFNIASSNSSMFADPIKKINTYSVSDGLPDGYVFRGNPKEPIELFLNAAPESYRTAMEAAVEEIGTEIGCLISDAFLWFAGEMAEKMDVPWVSFWTAGLRSLLVHVETDLIRHTLRDSACDETTLDFLPGCSKIRAVDLPEGVVHGNLESPFSTMLLNMGRNLSRATAITINSFEEADPQLSTILKTKFHNFLHVGPFNLTKGSKSFSDDYGCINWLDKQEPKSVVYISFGSFLSLPPHELAAMAEALQEYGPPFLWSLKENIKEKLPKNFLEKVGSQGKLVPWAPQMEVLNHSSVGVFVTHGGWNSVIESISGGVPMICRPFLGDQRLNMRAVEAIWGIGLGVGNGFFTKSGVVSSLELILSQEGGKLMREKVGELKELALKAVEYGGSSAQNFGSLVEIISNL